MGVTIIGTIGVVADAKLAGIIPSVKPVLSKIKATNFRITEQLEELILKRPGEQGLRPILAAIVRYRFLYFTCGVKFLRFFKTTKGNYQLIRPPLAKRPGRFIINVKLKVETLKNIASVLSIAGSEFANMI